MVYSASLFEVTWEGPFISRITLLDWGREAVLPERKYQKIPAIKSVAAATAIQTRCAVTQIRNLDLGLSPPPAGAAPPPAGIGISLRVWSSKIWSSIKQFRD